MLRGNIREKLDAEIRRNVFSYCGGKRDRQSGELVLNGETYEDEVPEGALECSQNGISVQYSDGGVSIVGDGKEIEIEKVGSSYSSDAGGLTVSGKEQSWMIRDGEIHEVDNSRLNTPMEPSQSLHDVCDQLNGYLSAWDQGLGRPGTSCRIRDAGGRGRVIHDGAHLENANDDEFVVEFGKITMGMNDEYKMKDNRFQGRFSAKKEDSGVSDGIFRANTAHSAQMAGSDR